MPVHARTRSVCLFTLIWLVAASLAAFVAPPGADVLADFDLRARSTTPGELLRPDLAALLEERLGVRVRVTAEPVRGVPGSLLPAFPERYLTPPSDLDHQTIARRFLVDQADIYGLTPSEVGALVVDTDYVTAHQDWHHLWFQQVVGGIPVHGGRIGVNLTTDGRIINVNAGPYVAGLVAAGEPPMPAGQAVFIAADNIGQSFLPGEAPTLREQPDARSFVFEPAHLGSPIRASATYLPMADGARLAWRVVIEPRGRDATYEVFVDATTGQVLLRDNMVDYDWFEALAYPIHPDATPVREVNGLLAADHPESPNGWYDPRYFTTRSNNVVAHADPNNCFGDGPFEDVPEVFDWDFNYPIDLVQEPATYRAAAITNLFVLNNRIHDRLYGYGFDEASGNFQDENFGYLPAGDGDGDAVDAQAQDGMSCGNKNNANFRTEVDGVPGRMQMYIWDYSTPKRDGDIDGDIVFHEFCHGLSHRLIGGRNCVQSCSLGTDQAGAMGEGWGDFFAASYSNDDAVGEYATSQPDGIRLRRFATSGWTLESLGNIPPGCQVHANGEIWGGTLWDIRQQFVDHYGLADGTPRIEQYVVDSLKIMTTGPSFLEARDAMIASAANRTDECLMWAGFAGRGMGEDAVDPNARCPSAVVNGFKVPDICNCTPGSGPGVEANSLRLAPSGTATVFQWSSSGIGDWNIHWTDDKRQLADPPGLWSQPATRITGSSSPLLTDPGLLSTGYFQVYGADACTGDSLP